MKTAFAAFVLKNTIKSAWMGALSLSPGEIEELKTELLNDMLELRDAVPPEQIAKMGRTLPEILLGVCAEFEKQAATSEVFK